jgi:NADH-quinone oxidoreductase subunit M
MVFAMASLGLPGLGNFVGEFLVLLGVYQANVTLAVLATLGFIVSTIYSLWMIQRAFFGPNQAGWKLPDATTRELAIMAVMIAAIVGLGLYPQPVLDTAQRALDALQAYTTSASRGVVTAPLLGPFPQAERGAATAPWGGTRP